MGRRQAKFHGCSDSESKRRKTPTESHIQRCSEAEYQHATKDANLSAQERLDGRRRYVSSPHCLFREGTFRASDKNDSRNSKLYCCHGYHVTEHMLLSTYANFHFFAFLLKSFRILKVSKGSTGILFLIHRNKGVDKTQSSLHRRPKSSTRLGFISWSLDGGRKRSSGEAKCQRRCHPWRTYSRIAAP